MCLTYRVTWGEEVVQRGHFKYPYSQLLVLYRLFTDPILNSFSFWCFSYSEKTIICRSQLHMWRKQQCQNLQERDCTDWRLLAWLTIEPRGMDTGWSGAPTGPRSAGAAAALRLSSSECLHLSPSLRCLPPPQAIWQKCAATLSSLFFYLEDNNSSYCCY